MRRTRSRGLGRNLALLLLSTFMTLVGGEIFFRLSRPIQYMKPPRDYPAYVTRQSLYRKSTIPSLSYEMVPNRDGTFEGMRVRTNSLGMRGGEPSAAKDPSRHRIVVLGDSFTFGFGMPEEATYPRVLERMLREREEPAAHRYEVLNLGVVGYTTQDEAIVLGHKGLDLAPRQVIIGYVLNDPETDPRPSLHRVFDEPAWWRYSHVLRLLHKAKMHWDVFWHGDGDYLRYLHNPNRRKWRSVVDALEAIRVMTVDRDIEVLLVIFPLVPQESWDQYKYADLHAQVSEEARARGFRVLDLQEPFSEHDPDSLVLSETDDHPSRLAHEITAQAIYEALLRQEGKEEAAPPAPESSSCECPEIYWML